MMQHEGEITGEYIRAWRKMSGQATATECRISDDTKIFRYVRKDRFLRLVEEGVNGLAHISMWDDPFEGFIFRSSNPDVAAFYRDFYGQSWTLCREETDLRWRAYCPNGDGVRMSTTVGALSASLRKAAGEEFFERCVCMAAVKYSDETDMNLLRKHIGWHYLVSAGCAPMFSLLFYKRMPFNNEEEYRVICNPTLMHNDLSVRAGVLFIPMDVSIIDSVLVDPRMSESDYNRVRVRALKTMPKLLIEKSQLYKWPDII